MRGLVYAVKDSRDPPNPKQFVAHPLHPSPRPVAVDRTNAIEYITAMLARRIASHSMTSLLPFVALTLSMRVRSVNGDLAPSDDFLLTTVMLDNNA